MLDSKKCESTIEVRFYNTLLPYESWLLSKGVELHQQWTPPGLPPRTALGGVEVDFAAVHTRARLVVETDGREYHSTDKQIQQDKHREARIVATGCSVLRFTGSDVFQDSAECVDKVLDFLLDSLNLDPDAEFHAIRDRVGKTFSKEAWLASAEGEAWKAKKDSERVEMMRNLGFTSAPPPPPPMDATTERALIEAEKAKLRAEDAELRCGDSTAPVITDGKYELILKKVFLGNKRKGLIFITDFEVFKAIQTDPEVAPNPVGSTCGYAVAFYGNGVDMANNNVKSFLLGGLLGEELAKRGTPTRAAQDKKAAALLESLVDNQEGRGYLIGCTAVTKEQVKDKTKTFTHRNWYRIEQTDAEIKTRREAIEKEIAAGASDWSAPAPGPAPMAPAPPAQIPSGVVDLLTDIRASLQELVTICRRAAEDKRSDDRRWRDTLSSLITEKK